MLYSIKDVEQMISGHANIVDVLEEGNFFVLKIQQAGESMYNLRIKIKKW